MFRDIIKTLNKSPGDRELAPDPLSDFGLIQHCAVAIFAIDKDHQVICWNKACERLTGIKAHVVLGTKRHWRAFYDTERPCLSDLIIDHQFDNIPDYYDVSRKSNLLADGWYAERWYSDLGDKRRYIIFDAAPIYDRKGRVIAVIETLQDITKRKLAEETNERIADELKKAVDKIRVLSGMLPICSACKKIRDDGGYWNRIESYIEMHSEAEFSHSLCPVCAKRLYPEFFDDMKIQE